MLVLSNGIEKRSILHWMTPCPLPATLTPVLICGWQDITDSLKMVEELQVENNSSLSVTLRRLAQRLMSISIPDLTTAAQ